MMRLRRLGILSAVGAGLLAGCGGESATPFSPVTGPDAASLYWGLALNVHAVTLSTAAPFNTISLVATPRDAHGGELSGLGTVTYRSSDPSRLQVGPDGAVTALQSGDGVSVTATLTAGNVTHSDSVAFSVTDEAAPPVPALLSIDPVPPNTTTISMTGDGSGITIAGDGSVNASFGAFLLFPTETDAVGTPIPGFIAHYESSDSTVATAGGFAGFAFVFPSRPGRATIVASNTAYGVPLADTVAFTFTAPSFQTVRIQPRTVTLGGPQQIGFVSSDVTIVPGGTALFINLSGQPVDVVFDDPTNVLEHGPVTDCAAMPEPPGGGNIAAFGAPQDPAAPALDPENCRSRQFPTPGVYTYHSTITGAAGRIVVNDGLSGP
jgi:hypothetical protein